MKWYVIAAFILLAFAGVWLHGCNTQKIKALKTENEYLHAEINLLIDTKPDTTIIYKQGKTVYKSKPYRIIDSIPYPVPYYVDTLDVSQVILTDTLKDENGKFWYTADIFGNMNNMVMGYKIRRPDTVRIETLEIREKPETWHLSLTATGYKSGASGGVQFEKNKCILGVAYDTQKGAGITVGYRLR